VAGRGRRWMACQSCGSLGSPRSSSAKVPQGCFSSKQSMAQGSTYIIGRGTREECRRLWTCQETLLLTLSNEAGWRPSAPATSRQRISPPSLRTRPLCVNVPRFSPTVMAMTRSTLVFAALAVMLLALATFPQAAAMRPGSRYALLLQTCLGHICLEHLPACRCKSALHKLEGGIAAGFVQEREAPVLALGLQHASVAGVLGYCRLHHCCLLRHCAFCLSTCSARSRLNMLASHAGSQPALVAA